MKVQNQANILKLPHLSRSHFIKVVNKTSITIQLNEKVIICKNNSSLPCCLLLALKGYRLQGLKMQQPPSKAESTKVVYIRRAKSLIASYERYIKSKMTPDDMAFIDFLILKTKNKTTANWRLLKAGCVYYFAQAGQVALSREIEKITSNHTHAKSLLRQTSSTKKKSVSESEKNAINQFLKSSANSESPSYYDRITVSMFNAILAVGLRPCEWEFAEILEESVECVALQPPILKVKNAKSTNGRSFADYRYIGITDLSELSVKFIEYTIHHCKSPADSRGNPITFDAFYHGIRNRMHAVVRKALPKSSSCITMYSARHQLIANLKRSGLGLVEIACIVGHGNDLTASEHYGKKRKGNLVKGLPLHNKTDEPKIRQIFRCIEFSKGNSPAKTPERNPR